MHARQAAEPGLVIDVSLQETLATMAIGELARAGLGRTIWSHRRTTDGNGAIVTILPASDAYADLAARGPQRAAWLSVMGSPDWGADPRFATKPDRVANWDALHALQHGPTRPDLAPSLVKPFGLRCLYDNRAAVWYSSVRA
ncbi:MAG: CoA transferase [Alphaproteobacteria bacterium]|nr:CoA transferase [Alphaproteobacteria bacterium]